MPPAARGADWSIPNPSLSPGVPSVRVFFHGPTLGNPRHFLPPELLTLLATHGLDGLHGLPGNGELSYEQMLALAERLGGNVPRGVRAETISALPVRSYEAKEGVEDVCSVCLSAMAGGEKVATLPCAHCFHEGCITPWLRGSRACPICRAAVGSGRRVEAVGGGW